MGLKLYDAWALYEDSVYESAQFVDWASGEWGGTIREVKEYAWHIMYPYSSHTLPPEGFCDEYISEKLRELKSQWKDENELEESLEGGGGFFKWLGGLF